jgi:hypothetical protein
MAEYEGELGFGEIPIQHMQISATHGAGADLD